MERIKTIFIFIIFFIPVTSFSQLDSIDYFGQETPGVEPEIFTPGYISVDGIPELGITFSPDGKEFCYSSDSKVYYLKKEGENWTDTTISYFVGDSGGVDPKFSPCGNLFTFQRNNDLYFCKKIDLEWSDPEAFPYPVNTEKREGSASVTLDSILYFTSNNRSGNTRGDIYRSTYFKDSSTTVEKINTLSTNDDEDGLYIAQDESYIIFWSWRSGGYGVHDLYISFRDESGNWTEPQNLDNTINTNKQEILCSVSPDGEYLFFIRGSDFADFDVYWVDANIIEQFRPDTTVSIINKDNIIHESKLSQNYPNPFNPSTMIQYHLQKSGHVILKIYNLSGQGIETLVNGFQTAGEYEVTWQPKGLPGGMYLYMLQVGEYYETRKFILKE